MRKRYDDTFKRDAVELLVSSGRPLKVLPADPGGSRDGAPPGCGPWMSGRRFGFL